MSIPTNITRDHILKVIGEINIKDIPRTRLSDTYFLVNNGTLLPPKFIISLANKLANGTELRNFNAVEAKNYLKKLNFELIEKKENVMNKVKLYDIHGQSAIENYKTLITPDDKYFYWDNNNFKKYGI